MLTFDNVPLLDLRLLDELDAPTFTRKSTEFRDRIARLTLEVEACDRGSAERRDLAEKAFELSQNLRQKSVKADARARRQLLQIVCLNCRLDGATPVPTIRKPFDVLAKGLAFEKMSGRLSFV